MGWICVIVIISLLVTILDSLPGKIIAGASSVAVGLLLLKWITGIVFFATLAKVCAVVIVIVIVGAILLALIN